MFRLRFFVKGDSLLDEETEWKEFSLPTSSRPLRLTALRGAKRLKDAQWFAFTAGGFGSEHDAWQEGQQLRDTLQYLAVRMKKSIDLGDDKPTGRMNDALKQRWRKEVNQHGEEWQIYDRVHGLAVHPEYPQPFIPDFWGRGSVEKPPGPSFEELLVETHALVLRLDERSSLACSLYGAAQVESSPRAQFLVLVTAIESLLEDEERVLEAVALVDRFIKSTRESALDLPEKNSLVGSLKWLRCESINRRGKQLVKKHLGNQSYGGRKAADFFRHCYSIRSQILHNGKPESEAVHISSLAHQLDKLVADLLRAIIGVSSEEV